MAKAEQNDRHERSKYKVYNKRRTNRLMRRAAKLACRQAWRDPQNAPTKPLFRGYSS